VKLTDFRSNTRFGDCFFHSKAVLLFPSIKMDTDLTCCWDRMTDKINLDML